MERSSRDLLRQFVGDGFEEEPIKVTMDEDSGEIELSLGLSLGGCFGVDYKGKKLIRSSSIASFLTLPREPEFPGVPVAALTRTRSLPVETEDELQKRKEIQSLKRLEAKRKRLERRNSIRSGAAKSGEKPDDGGSNGKGFPEQMVVNGQFMGARNCVAQPGLPTWAAGPKRTASESADVTNDFPPVSQGSIGSQGSCITSVRDMDGPATANQGLNSSTEANPRAPGAGKTHAGAEVEASTLTKQAAMKPNEVKEINRKMMEKMPFVSTMGNGPNGKKIEGFLYKYRNGEEVRIVCACHGSFLTPAEFVKHAGGLDVTNPLRHIVVSSSSLYL